MREKDTRDNVVDFLKHMRSKENSPPITTANNIVNIIGNTFLNSYIVINHESECITSKQAEEISYLIELISHLEQKVRREPFSRQEIRLIVLSRLNITTLNSLPSNRWSEANYFLSIWVHLLSSMAKTVRVDRLWFTEKYVIISSIVNMLSLGDRFRNHMINKYNVDSTAELSAIDLESVFRTVIRWFYSLCRDIISSN